MSAQVHRWFGVGAAMIVLVGVLGWRTLGGGSTAPIAVAVPNPRLSQLTPFAGAVSDSSVAAVSDENVALRRDPFAARPLPPSVRFGVDVTGASIDTSTRPAKIEEPKWRVSAILIGGAQRAAIINDVLVRVGDTLPGGTKLTSVEQDRVVLTESNGTAHTVAVREGES
jgi:hypothetical protein